MSLESTFAFDQSLSEESYQFIQKLIHDQTGIFLGPDKQSMVISRLGRRLRSLGLTSVESYISHLQLSPPEMDHFINSLTTNKTFFFREIDHYDFLQNTFFPEVLIKKNPIQPLYVWSAACSKGDEVYSLSMVFDEFIRQNPKFDFRILGTDIDTEIISKAKSGIYVKEALDDVPQKYRRYFSRGRGSNSGYYKIKENLRAKIKFRQFNLTDNNSRLDIKFDVIFLRNVLIYFQPDTIENVISKMAQHLNPGGLLFIGHCESLNNIKHDLKNIGPAIYKKTL